MPQVAGRRNPRAKAGSNSKVRIPATLRTTSNSSRVKARADGAAGCTALSRRWVRNPRGEAFMRLPQDSQDARPTFHPEADNSAHLRAFFYAASECCESQLDGLLPC